MRKTRIFIVIILTIAVIVPSLISLSTLVTNDINENINNEYDHYDDKEFDLSRLDLPYDTSTELTPSAHTAVMMEEISLDTDIPALKIRAHALHPTLAAVTIT